MIDPAQIFAASWQRAAGIDGASEAASAFWAGASTQADFPVTPERFAQFIATRATSVEELGGIGPHGAELLLVCACLDGNDAAIRRLDAHYLVPLRGRLGSNHTHHDEVLQLVREKLLMGNQPRLATYSGRGELRRFLRTVAVRTLVNGLRGQPEEPAESAFFERLSSVSNPEVEALRARYLPEFKAAFAEAWALLPARDQLWLRQYHLDGVKHERLAIMHDVVASTVSRSLEKTRNTLMKRVRDGLMRRGIAARDVDSVLVLLGSRLSLPAA